MFGQLGQVFRLTAGRALLAALVVGLGLAGFAASYASSPKTDLLRVRLGGDIAESRLVLDLDHAVNVKVVADGAADYRLVVALSGVSVPEAAHGVGRGLVKAWGIETAPGGALLTVDLAPEASLKRRFLLPPADGVAHYRYVIDLAGAPGMVLTKAVAPATTRPTLRTSFLPVRKSAPPPKPVVVIDPGHGGRDVGAKGSKGFEKDVNLAAAKVLKARLERGGNYKVVMTRNSDLYIPLETRVRIAQRVGADLFISLHSDSGPEAHLQGASVYTLSDKASQRSTQFINRDDWFMKASLTRDQGVRNILFDLTQQATRNRSAIFAQTLLSSIEGQTPLLRRSHRNAGFMVLLAPDVPAVLLEMGFLSNSQDEKMLRDPVHRERLMNAVGDAIEAHFNEAVEIAAR